MERDEMLELLAELVTCHSPPGEEGEIDRVLRREFEASDAEVWQDDATNLYARLPGDGPKVMVCAHKDEIGLIVREVREDGRLLVENIGGSWPWKYGEGPVEILGDDGQIVRGILSVGSVHTNTGPVQELKSSLALMWRDVTVFTGRTPEQLENAGVHIGSRGVVARERKGLERLGDYIASFALDDRLGLVVLVAALKRIVAMTAPHPDLYFVATHGEEIGMIGAVRAAQQIQPDVCVALDTSPAAHGTPVVVDDRPVIWYREATYHNKSECDKLLHLARELRFGAQPCLYAASASDAGRIKQAGLAGRTVCFGFARDNSHGFEIAHRDSLVHVTHLLIAYLQEIE